MNTLFSILRLPILLTAAMPFAALSATQPSLKQVSERCGPLLTSKGRKAFSQWEWESGGVRAKSLSEIAPNTFISLKRDAASDEESVNLVLKNLGEKDPLGNGKVSNHQVQIGTRNDASLDSISSTRFVPYFITAGELDKLVAPPIRRAVISTVEKLSSDLVSATGREIERIELSIRATSDQMGARVTTQNGGNSESGLHIHGERDPLDRQVYVGFTFPIKGHGSKYLEGDTVYQAKDDEILVMGIEVPHGSPERTKPELIVVGTIWLGPKK